MKTLAFSGLAALLAVAWMAAPTAGLADDVNVKVIKPDAPAPSPSPAPARTDSPIKFDTGGFGDRAFRGLNLTAEQVKSIQPMVDPIAQEIKANNEDLRKKMDDLRAKGGTRDDMGKLFAEAREKNDKLRAQLLEKVGPLLTDAQKTQLKDQLASRGPGGPGGPGRFNPQDMVTGMLDRAGLNLTEDQKKKIGDKLAATLKEQEAQGREMFQKMRELGEQTRKEGGDPEAQKELDALRGKMRDQFDAGMKAVSDQIRAELTPEQQTKFDEGQAKLRAEGNRFAIQGVARRADRAGATDDQKKKIEELTKAAAEAVDKLKADDRTGRDQLLEQLRKDVRALLSEDAQKKFDQDRGFGGFRDRGDQGDRGRRNRDGGRTDRPAGSPSPAPVVPPQ